MADQRLSGSRIRRAFGNRIDAHGVERVLPSHGSGALSCFTGAVNATAPGYADRALATRQRRIAFVAVTPPYNLDLMVSSFASALSTSSG